MATLKYVPTHPLYTGPTCQAGYEAISPSGILSASANAGDVIYSQCFAKRDDSPAVVLAFTTEKWLYASMNQNFPTSENLLYAGYLFSREATPFYYMQYLKRYDVQTGVSDYIRDVTAWFYCDSVVNIGGNGYVAAQYWRRTTTSPPFEYNCTGIYNGVVVGEFNSVQELLNILDVYSVQAIPNTFPITYRTANATVPDGPEAAEVNSTVTVRPVFSSGYGIVNPSTDIYVTSNGVTIPSTYANGVLTFTMPDPS